MLEYNEQRPHNSLGDLSLNDLTEGIALHAPGNKSPFSVATLKKIVDLKRVYGLNLMAGDSHQLRNRAR